MSTSITHIRPRFEFTLDRPARSIITGVKSALADAPDHITGKVVDDHIMVTIVGEDRHFWSPHLEFRVEVDMEDEERSTVSGLIGPSPAVWTLFMFIYFMIALIGFSISSYGVSKWMIGEYSHTLWAFPVAIALMFTAYLAGKSGEKLGEDQIEQLKSFLRTAIDRIED